MMTYDLACQLANDLDWFLLDENNVVAHFSSGRGILPNIIAGNATDTILLKHFFKNLPAQSEVVINPTLEAYWPANAITEDDLKARNFYASKGILSFDKTFKAHPGDITYHLVASPVTCLTMDKLPGNLKKASDKMRVNISFADFYKLDAGYSPWASLFENYTIKPVYEVKPTKKKRFWYI